MVPLPPTSSAGGAPGSPSRPSRCPKRDRGTLTVRLIACLLLQVTTCGALRGCRVNTVTAVPSGQVTVAAQGFDTEILPPPARARLA